MLQIFVGVCGHHRHRTSPAGIVAFAPHLFARRRDSGFFQAIIECSILGSEQILSFPPGLTVDHRPLPVMENIGKHVGNS